MAACLALSGAAPAFSESSSSEGSIQVSVTDANGKAAVGIQVRLYAAKAPAKKTPSPTSTFIRIRRTGIERVRRAHGPPLLQGSTNNAGVYTFSNVEPGDYVVAAGVPGGTTAGHARTSVTAGQQAEVAITLEPKKIKNGT